MEVKKHANSKTVTIFRAGTFAEDAQTGAQDFMAMSRKSIGSYYQHNFGKGIGSGLSFEEIDLLLPLLIDIPATERTFRAAVTDFFSSISTNIPYKEGRTFEVGLHLENDKPVTHSETREDGRVVYNLPINLNDYIRYRHAENHPRVANSKSNAAGNSLIEYYIFDPTQVADENTALTTQKDEAFTLYLTLKDDPKKVDMLLTLMKEDPRMYHGTNAVSERMQALRALVDTKPDKVLTEHKAAHFEERYTLLTLVNTGICKQIGGRYVETETSTILGNTAEEAIYWILDKVNSDKLTLMKARMQEQLKVAVVNPKRRAAKTTAR